MFLIALASSGRRITLLLSLLMLLCGRAGAADISTGEAIQLTSPVKIVSTNNSQTQLGELLILRNDTNKNITAVKIDWAVLTRPVTATPQPLLRGSLGKFIQPLNPKRRMFIYQQGVSLSQLYEQLHRQGVRSAVELIFGLSEVVFADGTRWQADLIADSAWGPEAPCPTYMDKPLFRNSPQGEVVVQSQETLENRAVRRVLPDYPVQARKLAVKTIVTLELLIDEAGKVIDARVTAGDERFHSESLKAARQWTFKPLQIDGKARKMLAEMTFLFLNPNI
ncbi:MAG: energy transducer TonB [Acidobacteriota bacterium]